MSVKRGAACCAVLAVLFASGCERALFAFVNRGVAAPEASVVYARGLALDVYRPVAADRAAPVVVFFHGGEWKRGTRAEYRFVGRRLAGQGMVAIIADYRMYPRTTFPGFVEDGAAAVAWAVAHAARYGGDPERVFVAGHSAGAQIAALIGTDARYLRAHGLAPRDLAGVIGLSGPYDFRIGPGLQPVFAGRGDEAQPVRFVDGDEPRFLLIHGMRDAVVESADSEILARRLRANGVQARVLLLPDGTHTTPLAGLYASSRAPAVLPAIEAFVAQQ
jgi:acetyl esterase/lipase